jgi:NADP-dependent 3-hydroxy acid dehydrogenase YdfG
VERAGGSARAYPVDIRDFAGLEVLARTVMAEHGRVDVLFANAGIDEQSSICLGDPAVWHEVVETNLVGTAQTVRAFLPAMIEQDRGDILVTGSTSGRDTPIGNPLYGASKWGLVGFARALRHELEARQSGVRVTLIDTGLVDTPLSRSIPALRARLAGGCALLPEDIARLVSFVIQQPPHVLLPELRVEPVIRSVPPTFVRKTSNRLVGLIERRPFTSG